MTVSLLPKLPAVEAESVAQLLASPPDSIAVSKVLHDGFIELSSPMLALNTTTVAQDQAAVSGAFVRCNNRFYIVQGRIHTDATLDKWEQMTGRKIAPACREQYKQKGGALQLEGKCCVLGILRSGKEVLDRIAALPNDANGKPLQAVPLRIEGGQ